MKGYTMNKKQAQKAFTLAELLITLSVIGLVAILTIPTMIENHQQKAWNTASTVFERKLEEALKSMNTQETLAGHANTLDFVNELAKNIKIKKICNNNELTSCFEEKIHWGTDSEEIEMSKIKNAKHFGQENWETENIGIQFANGVTGIIAYNPACTQDPYNNQYTGINCIAMLYDTDGFKTPNQSGKDLRGINVLSLGNINCAIELSDGTCFTAPFRPKSLTMEECQTLKDKLGIEVCYSSGSYGDYWGGAVKQCGGVQNMPTQSQLDQLAKDLYPETTIYADETTSYGKIDENKTFKMGFSFSGGWFAILSGELENGRESYARIFDYDWTERASTFRDGFAVYNGSGQTAYAVCIAD